MKTITLTLTIDEANLVLDGIGRLPFAKVYTLVNKIQGQAKAQMANGNASRVPAQAQPAPPIDVIDASDEGDEVEHVQ